MSERKVRLTIAADAEDTEAVDECICELEKIGAMAELLLKNAGGLSEKSTQALGDSINCSLNTINGILPNFFTVGLEEGKAEAES